MKSDHLLLLGLTVVTCLAFTIGYNYSQKSLKSEYRRGVGDGVEAALDTVNKIITKRRHVNDTTVAKVTLVVHKDTNTYFLSRNTITK